MNPMSSGKKVDHEATKDTERTSTPHPDRSDDPSSSCHSQLRGYVFFAGVRNGAIDPMSSGDSRWMDGLSVR